MRTTIESKVWRLYSFQRCQFRNDGSTRKEGEKKKMLLLLSTHNGSECTHTAQLCFLLLFCGGGGGFCLRCPQFRIWLSPSWSSPLLSIVTRLIRSRLEQEKKEGKEQGKKERGSCVFIFLQEFIYYSSMRARLTARPGVDEQGEEQEGGPSFHFSLIIK